MWMCNEGIYLNILLSYAVFNNNHRKIIAAFYVVGWILPLLICSGWGLSMYLEKGIGELCWLGFNEWRTYWIIKVPVFISLFVSI
jgi:hypothetical protein